MTSNREDPSQPRSSTEGETTSSEPSASPATQMLHEYFASKDVSPEDVETTIRVLNAITALAPSSRHHPNKKRKQQTDDTTTTESSVSKPGALLEEYRSSKTYRPVRKAINQCYLRVVQPVMFEGHNSLEEFRIHKDSLNQVKKRKMAESHQQQKHIANTLLRRGRIEKLNAKLQEGQDEEQRKLQARMMIPDGHVETLVLSQPLLLTDRDDDKEGLPPATKKAKPEDPIVETVDEEGATVLPKLRSCYVCKARFRILHKFYDQLCPDCAALNWENRHKTRDLNGKVAVVTGSRVKIGFQTCLKLLRAGCYVIATTRFPNAAAEAYRKEPDFEHWKDRLEIYGLDLRDVTGLELFCRYLHHKLERGLDILINNACQTIRRPSAYYLPACQKEQDLWKDADATHKGLLKGCLEYERLRRKLHLTTSNGSGGSMAVQPLLEDATNEAPQPTSLASTTAIVSSTTETPFETTGMSHSAAASQMILCPEDVGLDDTVLPKGLSDINGQQLDLRKTNSWLLKMDQVSTPELMECMFVNAIAPFVLNSRLQPLLTQRTSTDPKEWENRYIVNVSAMEGKFYRYKMANHPHTNMAKSALNMMTRTAAEDLAQKHGVYMNSIDTGWINDENPLEKAAKTAKVNNFQTPIDEIDAAARLVDPIFSDSKVYGKFLKDYRETEW